MWKPQGQTERRTSPNRSCSHSAISTPWSVCPYLRRDVSPCRTSDSVAPAVPQYGTHATWFHVPQKHSFAIERPATRLLPRLEQPSGSIRQSTLNSGCEILP